jgi:epoxide hydrolase-like predicted phosphatase
MIRAVIFDFGGVLVRTENFAGRLKWEQSLGLPKGELSRQVFESDSAVQATIGKVPEQAVWDRIGQVYNLTPAQLAELQTDFWIGDRLDQELVNFLRMLRAGRAHYKTAILSNAWSGARLSFHEKYALETAVDLIVISAEEGIAKPDARIYTLAASRLGVLPDEVVFVDDFPENIQAAQTVGFHAILYRTTRQTIDEILLLLKAAIQPAQ